MIPVAFDYKRAGSADEALALLAEYGDDSKLMAGGHSLLPMMKHDPYDPNLPRFLKQVEVILAWRAAVPLRDRFWRVDRSE